MPCIHLSVLGSVCACVACLCRGHAVQNTCEHAGLHLMRWCVLCDSRALLRRGESLGAGDV